MLSIARCVLAVSLWSGTLLIQAPCLAQSPSRDCRDWLAEHQTLDLEYIDELLIVPCTEAAQQIIDHVQGKLDARRTVLQASFADMAPAPVDGRPRFSELNWESLDQYQQSLSQIRDLVGIKAALNAGQLTEARSLLQRMKSARRQQDTAIEDLWQIYRLDVIAATLDQTYFRLLAVPVRVDAPAKEWSVQAPGCVDVEPNETARFPAPDVADALVAMNRHDEAMVAFLVEHWTEAAARLELPWRLRQLAEAIYGPESSAAAFESALASIRIDQDPNGRTASLSMFGVWLPLPVAVLESPDPHALDVGAAAVPRHDYTLAEYEAALRASWASSAH